MTLAIERKSIHFILAFKHIKIAFEPQRALDILLTTFLPQSGQHERSASDIYLGI
jgi:hypothetical protein